MENEDGYLCEKDFGTYIVSEDWKELDMLQDGRYVYALKGSDVEDEFNNFVIGRGENSYSEEEHE